MPERVHFERSDEDVASAARTVAEVCRNLATVLAAIARVLEASPVVRAVGARDGAERTGFLSFPPFHIDLENETLWRDGVRIPLRSKPFHVLRHLAEHPQRLVTHRELIEAVWGKVATSDSLLRTHIRRLRQAVGHGIIETVNGRGYRLLPAVSRMVELEPHARHPARRGDSHRSQGS